MFDKRWLKCVEAELGLANWSPEHTRAHVLTNLANTESRVCPISCLCFQDEHMAFSLPFCFLRLSHLPACYSQSQILHYLHAPLRRISHLLSTFTTEQ